MKLTRICRVIVLLVLFSNIIFYSSAELQNSVMLDKNATEITVWNSEVAKYIDFSYELVGNGTVTIILAVLDKPNYNFTVPAGNQGGVGWPNVLSISLSLFTKIELNPNVTVYWEINVTSMIPSTSSHSDSIFDLNLDIRSDFIVGVVGVIVIFVLGYIYGSRIYKKRRKHGRDLYP